MSSTALLPPAGIDAPGLSGAERGALADCLDELSCHAAANLRADAYYRARQIVTHMGVGMPPELVRKIAPVSGWPGIVVDVLEERLDWNGWSDDGLGLSEVFDENFLDIESGPAHLDALVFGVGFVRVGNGGPGEPPVVVSCHSPMRSTGLWDSRSRRLTAGLTIEPNADASAWTAWLDLPGVLVTLECDAGGPWRLAGRMVTGVDEVPMVPVVNRTRRNQQMGRSEITAPVRYLADHAVRVMMAMEGNREFYSIPQMTMVGRGAEAFVDVKSGQPVAPWRVLAGHVIAVDVDERGNVPQIDQLTTSSPTPFLEQLNGLAASLAAHAGMPASYLGLATQLPSSADAIRAGEARLVKRAERRQRTFGRAWLEVARLALLFRDGAVPDGFGARVRPVWRDAATPTRAASADAAVKLVQAGILPPDGDMVLQMIGLSPEERRQVRADRAGSPGRGADLLAAALNRQISGQAGGGGGVDTAGA